MFSKRLFNLYKDIIPPQQQIIQNQLLIFTLLPIFLLFK